MWQRRGGRAHGPGRPTTPWRQTAPASFGCLVWASTCLIFGAWPVLSWFVLILGLHLVELSLNGCSNIFCDFMLTKVYLQPAYYLQKHILHILEVKCGLRVYLDKDARKKCKLL